MLEADLDTSAPSAHTLLNINMVIWQDGQGKWGASEDKCPHRYIAELIPAWCNVECVTYLLRGADMP